jgi:hypothetical protein
MVGSGTLDGEQLMAGKHMIASFYNLVNMDRAHLAVKGYECEITIGSGTSAWPNLMADEHVDA